MLDAPSCHIRSPPLGSPYARSWAEVAALSPMVGDRSTSVRHLEVHGVFRRVEKCHNGIDARQADVVVCEDINKDTLNELLQAAFEYKLVLFPSQIRGIREACQCSLRRC
jgi:hypothetical protein